MNRAFQIVIENVNTLPPRHHTNNKLRAIRRFDHEQDTDVWCMSELNVNWHEVTEENKLQELLRSEVPTKVKMAHNSHEKSGWSQ